MDLAAIIIAGISLVVAIASFCFSIPAQRLQNKLNEVELKLKEYELDRVKEESTKKACVEARVIKIAKGKYRLKVWNSGNETAKNVNVKFNEEANIMLMSFDKLPFEILEPRKSFEVSLLIHNGSASKFVITTEWMDEAGEVQSKEQMGDI